jgi:hypothetical protein
MLGTPQSLSARGVTRRHAIYVIQPRLPNQPKRVMATIWSPPMLQRIMDTALWIAQMLLAAVCLSQA